MNSSQVLLGTGLQETEGKATPIVTGRVLAVRDDGSVLVEVEGANNDKLWCDLLHTSEHPTLRLSVADRVLLWFSPDGEEQGVVLGRIGTSHAPSSEAQENEHKPHELVIEAKENLTLKCGDGSITLRSDGKILIKGKDLVSRAGRMNRIKGGAVAIN